MTLGGADAYIRPSHGSQAAHARAQWHPRGLPHHASGLWHSQGCRSRWAELWPSVGLPLHAYRSMALGGAAAARGPKNDIRGATADVDPWGFMAENVKHARLCGRRPHRGLWRVVPREPQGPVTEGGETRQGLRPQAASGGVGGRPPTANQGGGRWLQATEQGGLVSLPRRGGERGRDTRSGPGGVGRPRSSVKLIRGASCMPQTYSDQPVMELQHIWVGSEQMSRRIVCRYRIFLAGGPWGG